MDQGPERPRSRAGGGGDVTAAYGRSRLLPALLGLVLAALALSAGASPRQDGPAERFAAQQREIDATLVQPCKSDKLGKAAQIRQSISTCPCSAEQKQQESGELAATLQKELRRCEQQGADALDQYKRWMIAGAQDDFERFGAQLDIDRQVLRNLGFERTVDEMESWTRYGEEAQQTYTRQAQSEVIGKFFQALHLKAAAAATPPQMTSQQAVSLYNLFKATGVEDPELFDALAAAGRGDPQIPERVLWERVTDRLEKAGKAQKILHTQDDVASILSSMLDVAGWIAPELRPALSIVKDGAWIGYATYSHAKVAYGRYAVDRLTVLTEGQLQELAPVTHRLKQDVDGLVAAKRTLKWAGSGDSTNLVRKPSD